MSKKPINYIELQGREDSFQGAMSDPTGTDVGGMAPLYNTVQEAHSDVQQYKNKVAPSNSLVQEDYTIPVPLHTRPQAPSNSLVQEVQEDYTVPGPMDPPNEYQMMTGMQREDRSPGYLHQSNILYGDQFAAQQMKHATLTRSDQHKYSGSMSKETVKEPREGCGSGCGSGCLLVTVILVFIVVALLAIAALVMVVMVIVQVIPVCNCADSMAEVQDLRRMVEQLSTALESTSNNVSSLSLELSTLNVIPAVEEAIAERITANGTILGLSFSAELRDFEPFSDCETRVERTCVITRMVARCETTELQYIVNSELNHTEDAQCIRMPGTTDQNIISTVLEINEETNDVFCLCYRQRVDNNIVDDITCGLQVTRCRPSRTVPVNIVTTSSATQIAPGN